MMETNKIQKLKSSIWSNKYFCKLALLDHIRECLEKDNFLKATNQKKNSEAHKNLDEQLMDLKIILDLYFDNENNLYEKRISKFLENLEK